ncbi:MULTISPECIES: hypothetical protein [Morganellaceae]|uniref:hypothetical protein n=1 Tax=Morganellaceae TaxID=1903414 RepID=UPI001BD959DC|nr:hypothetical protein [Morganella morganii]MBT0520923.1 hypothetical protein [Morganella morganii subsp. morganii]QWL90494.1 hypothetical protein IZ187_04670 [Morganella morganii subsp. morganii]HCR4038236.1 hypothetical protein [Morganella morganii]HCR4040463.1 hypothetical protein [Morganella morganii]HEI8511784.1 hypothetical protein [Morganella morganii]
MNKTLGQKLVGISFNPSALPAVDEAKQKSAELIDLVHANMLDSASEEALMIHNEALRRIMDAQMWAVKAITWKD